MEINIYCRIFKSNKHWGEGVNIIQKHTDRVDCGTPTTGNIMVSLTEDVRFRPNDLKELP